MGQRHRRDHAVAGAERERGGDGGGLGRHVRVRQDDGLGRPGRPRRELHERCIREVGGGDSRARDQRQRRQSVDGEGGRRASDRGRDTRRIGLGGHDQLWRETAPRPLRARPVRAPAVPARPWRGCPRPPGAREAAHAPDPAPVPPPRPLAALTARTPRRARAAARRSSRPSECAIGVDDPCALKRMGECHASQARRGSDHAGDFVRPAVEVKPPQRSAARPLCAREPARRLIEE